jgi:hypothetical protein
MPGHAKASMTFDVYADLFDEDLDGVADRLDAAIRSTTAGDLIRLAVGACPDLLKLGGAKGIRTPTFSMRTRRTGRLLTLTALASLTKRRSRG